MRFPFSIRPIEPNDFDAILVLWTKAGLPYKPATRDSRESFLRQLERFPTLYLCAVADRQLIGVVLGTHDERKGWINRLAVLPEFRRRGVASRLVTACESALQALGIPIFAALIEPHNSESVSFFGKLGFQSDVPVVYMRKLSRPDA